MAHVLPIAIVILSGIVYHLAQKASGSATPWSMLAVAYGAAFAATIVLALANSAGARWQPSRGDVLGGLALGAAAFGIEAGFFFIYRSGWPLASASVIINASVTAVLLVVGLTTFGEHLTVARGAGLALALGGAALIARG